MERKEGTRTMKGIVCEQIGVFRLRHDLPEPLPASGTAIVRVKRIGICGTDLHAFRGNQPFFTYPRILGHELSGIVEEVEPNDAGLATGDQVAVIPYMHCGVCRPCRTGMSNCCKQLQVLGVHIDGGMRERIAVPIAHLIRTNGLSLDEAALLEPLAIGAHAVRRAAIAAGDTALVIGAGPIGLGVMAMAKRAGAAVMAMDLNEERLRFCQAWAHVDHVMNPAQTDVKQRLAEWTDEDGPTAVFDATGNARSMTSAFDWVGHGGNLIFVGLVKEDISFRDPEFHKREMTLMGSRNATLEDFRCVLDALESRAIDIRPYITHRASFDDMIESFGEWLKPEANVVKAIVEL